MLLAAFASPVVAAETQSGELEVQVWPGAASPGQVVVIVALRLPEDYALPTTVRLPVPPGMTVGWAGEISGAGGEDVEREFRLGRGSGGEYAEFEVASSRQCQIEASGLLLDVSGSRYSASVDFVQSVPSELTAFSVRLPAGATEASIDPAPSRAPERNQAGEELYTLPSRELEPGDSQRVTLAYSLGAEPPTQGGAATSDRRVLGVLLALLAVALVVLLASLLMRRRGSNRA